MSSTGSGSTTCNDIGCDQCVNSNKPDELVFEVYYGSVFMYLPLRYAGGEVIDLKLSRSSRLCYSEMCDILLKNIKEDIWAWFYCKPMCSVEEGLTIVETDNDVKRLYEFAEINGVIQVFVCAIPQAHLVTHYHKNLAFDDSDDAVTSKVRVHEKRKKEYEKMSLEEIIAWEQAEQNTPGILKTPYPKPFVEACLFRGRGDMEYNDDSLYSPEGFTSVNDPYIPKDCDCGCRCPSFLNSLVYFADDFAFVVSTPVKGKRDLKDLDDDGTAARSTFIQKAPKESRFQDISSKGRKLLNDFESVSDDVQHVCDGNFVVGGTNECKCV